MPSEVVNETTRALGKRLKELRAKSGKTQTEFADLLGTTQVTVSNLERGLGWGAAGWVSETIDRIFGGLSLLGVVKEHQGIQEIVEILVEQKDDPEFIETTLNMLRYARRSASVTTGRVAPNSNSSKSKSA